MTDQTTRNDEMIARLEAEAETSHARPDERAWVVYGTFGQGEKQHRTRIMEVTYTQEKLDKFPAIKADGKRRIVGISLSSCGSNLGAPYSTGFITKREDVTNGCKRCGMY